FFTTSINTPSTVMATVQGQDTSVSGPYALGKTVYGTKTFMEAVTGKPQFSAADDIGLPAYLLGSIPSIYNSGVDVFTGGNYAAFGDLTAGGLFGFGSAYLWKRDSDTWNKFLKPRLTSSGKSEPPITNLQNTELIPSVAK